MQGWIKLHRQLNNWEWKDSPKHVAVFFDILLNVNHKDKKYRGEIVKAGSMTTSYAAISKRTGVSLQSVRTVIKDLNSTHEITYKSTPKYSMISITNWEKYQGANTVTNNQLTINQQSTNNQLTTNKNVKNVNNENKYKLTSTYDGNLELIYDAYPRKQGKASGIKRLQSVIKNKDDYNEILNGVKAYKNYCEKNNIEKKYIKLFSTFINQKCWLDDYGDEKSNQELLREKEIEFLKSIGVDPSEAFSDYKGE
jgi:hypothetical protein